MTDVREHPNASVVRRSYEALARGDAGALAELVEASAIGLSSTNSGRTPLSIAAVGDLVVVIDRVGTGNGQHDRGVAVFRIANERIVAALRLLPSSIVG